MIKHGDRLPREVLESPFLEILKQGGHGPNQPAAASPAWAEVDEMTSWNDENFQPLSGSVLPQFAKNTDIFHSLH